MISVDAIIVHAVPVPPPLLLPVPPITRHIAVVPSTSIPSGLAAMVAYDAEGDAVGNARVMGEAIEDVHSAEVTRALPNQAL